MERIAPLDLNVMRVALFEIEHTETPHEVAIDQAMLEAPAPGIAPTTMMEPGRWMGASSGAA